MTRLHAPAYFDRLAIPHGDDNLTGHRLHTVEIAAENLVFRGVVSAMDLCAGAISRLSGHVYPADRERSVAWWFDKKHPDRLSNITVPQPLSDWLKVFNDNTTWKLATEIRHVFTHRSTRRDVTLLVGDGTETRGAAAKFEVDGALHDADDLMPRLITFGTQRFSDFERAVSRSYPMR